MDRKTTFTPKNSLPKPESKDSKINSFLKAVPYLTFSDTGLKNIASRFGITLEELKNRIADFEAKEGQKNG